MTTVNRAVILLRSDYHDVVLRALKTNTCSLVQSAYVAICNVAIGHFINKIFKRLTVLVNDGSFRGGDIDKTCCRRMAKYT